MSLDKLNELNELNELDELDDLLINNFETTDKLYQDFYKDNVYYIKLQFIYINKKYEIEKIKQETFLMKIPNKISKEEIIEILIKNSTDNEIKYKILSLLKYNITIDTNEIKGFLQGRLTTNFLHIIKNIDDIILENSINMFQDLNELIILFVEKTPSNKKHNITKRFMKLSNKYTKRNN